MRPIVNLLKLAKEGPVEKLGGLIGCRYTAIQRLLVARLPIHQLPRLLVNPATKASVRKLIFDKLPYQMVPFGFKTAYYKHVIGSIMNG